jgi:hypothetical protein
MNEHGVREIVHKAMWSISNYFREIVLLLLNINDKGDSEVLNAIKVSKVGEGTPGKRQIQYRI